MGTVTVKKWRGKGLSYHGLSTRDYDYSHNSKGKWLLVYI